MDNKKSKFASRLFTSLFALLVCFSAVFGAADYAVDDTVSVFAGSDADIPSFVNIGEFAGEKGSYTVPVSVMGIDLKNISVSVYDEMKLIPGGMPFGIKFTTDGVLVVGMGEVETDNGFVCPAKDAGIQIKDIIKSAGGKKINSNEEFVEAVENSNGQPITVTALRDEKELSFKITPAADKTDGRYKAGLWVKDSTAGIGTVTFIVPDDNTFGGLGHGVCDTDTGVLMPFGKGNVCDVNISGVARGKAGTPGELRGFFANNETGVLYKNTVCGVFGRFSSLPKNTQPPIPIGLKGELVEGHAEVICTTAENSPTVYDIEIVKINRDSGENKNFIVKVTDERLLEKTGGIVQGMSGSPIIQNGKLVGAVTHVLINDPTRGYGIFIENMLSAAK